MAIGHKRLKWDRVLPGVVVLAVALAACQAGTTVPMAGSGPAGNTGDGGPATSATLGDPTQVAVTPDGSFYVADSTACVIRRVDAASGDISTIAGTGTCGESGDGGAATSAAIDPSKETDSMAVGPDGSLWFTQEVLMTYAGSTFPIGWHLRRVLPDGTMTTPSLSMANVSGVTFAPDGTMYVSDGSPYVSSSVIYEVTSGGAATPVYSSTTSWLGPIAAVGSGELAIGMTPISGYSNGTVARLDLGTGTPTQVLSVGGNLVRGVSASPDGNIYAIVSDESSPTYLNQVVRVGPDDSVAVIAGNGVADPASSAQSGLATDLPLTPEAIMVTPHNGLLVTSGHVVYRVAGPAAA